MLASRGRNAGRSSGACRTSSPIGWECGGPSIWKRPRRLSHRLAGAARRPCALGWSQRTLLFPGLSLAFAFVAVLAVPILRAAISRHLLNSYRTGFGQSVISVLAGVGVIVIAAGFIFWQVAAVAHGGRYPAGVFSGYAAGIGLLIAQTMIVRQPGKNNPALEREIVSRARGHHTYLTPTCVFNDAQARDKYSVPDICGRRRRAVAPPPAAAAAAGEDLQGSKARQRRGVALVVGPLVGGESVPRVVEIDRNIGVGLRDRLDHAGADHWGRGAPKCVMTGQRGVSPISSGMRRP